MAFTFSQARKLSPDEANPMNALISRAMETFGKGMNLSYLPREKEAGIFSKEIGPLAALASNPNFTGFNPEVQKMIAQKIGGYLGGQQGAQQATAQGTTPGYASDQDIYGRLKHGSDITQSPGGQLKTAKSNLVGQAEKWGLPHVISQLLGGSETAGESAAFDQVKDEAIQKLKLKGYSEGQAKKIIEQRKGESNNAYNARIKPLFINENQMDSMGDESQMESANEGIQFALSLSQQIKERTGKDIPENVIFDYMQKHPGKLNIPKLLKAVGSR